MESQLERRSAALELRGRTVKGLAVPYGARARVKLPSGEHVQETFVSGSFGETMKDVPLFVEHGGKQVGEVTPSTSARGLELSGSYEGDLGDRSQFSIEFRSKAETRSQDLRIVTSALLEGVAAVASPAYQGARIEVRQGEAAELHLVLGPVAAGKSSVLAEMLRSGAIDLAADTTGLWTSLALAVRDPETGRYPVRRADDPALAASLYAKTVVTRWALQNRYRVGVTASSPGAEAKWRQLAEELSSTFDLQVIDPGEAVVRERLGGEAISNECQGAVQRWYGSSRSAGLSTARRRLLAAV